jgi:hypothetical protein
VIGFCGDKGLQKYADTIIRRVLREKEVSTDTY